MADEFDRNDNDSGGGGSFVMGLLTGTVLGAGLGMLFAPKAGSELRNQVREQAGNLANSASDGYRRAAETAGQYAGRAAETAGQVSRGTERGPRYGGRSRRTGARGRRQRRRGSAAVRARSDGRLE